MSASWKVPVALTEYTVSERKHLKVDGEECLGVTDFGKRTITLRRGTTTRATRLTFWHEYMHAILRELGHTELAENEALVEGIAQSLARAIAVAPRRMKS